MKSNQEPFRYLSACLPRLVRNRARPEGEDIGENRNDCGRTGDGNGDRAAHRDHVAGSLSAGLHDRSLCRRGDWGADGGCLRRGPWAQSVGDSSFFKNPNNPF